MPKDFFKILLLFFIIFSCFACTEEVNENSNFQNPGKENIYKNDKTLQSIVEFQLNKNTVELVKFVNDDNVNYRIQSLYALSSIGDTSCLVSIKGALDDEDSNVRSVAAYAIGRIGSPSSESFLIEKFKSENNPVVKKEILVAIGKCGTDESVKFIGVLDFNKDDLFLLEGQARAFYFLADRGYLSAQIIDKTMSILTDNNIDEETKLEYSYLFTVESNLEIEKYFSSIKYELENRQNIFLLSNLTLSLKHIKTEASLNLLRNIILAETDSRIKVSAIKALYSFNYHLAKEVIFEATKNKNSSIAIAASEYLLDNGDATDANKYLNLSEQVSSIEARSDLYKAALFFATNKKQITDKIISGYNVATNIYEKAGLLYALSADPSMYKFVSEETFSATDKIVSTEGIKALYLMRLHPNFNYIAYKFKENFGEDLFLEFKFIFKEAMASNDKAMIYYAAKIMNKFPNDFFDEFENTFFLNQALQTLSLPKDLITYKELCKTINNYGSQGCDDNFNFSDMQPDWDYISSIPGNQRVEIETSKGDFEIMLDVNSSPITVSNFLLLAQQNYYSNISFYRNIPNFGVCSGSKRGDGWSNSSMAYVSEFRNRDFYEGSVAMDVIADNFLTTNWLISTTQSIDSPGKYSVFGQVIVGMDVVRNLEVGDEIYHVKIL